MPTRPAVAEPSVVEPIEEESFLEEYDEEDDDGLEIELQARVLPLPRIRFVHEPRGFVV